jgi:hypothetical protein
MKDNNTADYLTDAANMKEKVNTLRKHSLMLQY